VAGPPPRAWGWLRPPPTTGRWCPKPPLGPRGWSGHPQNPKPIFSLFFFFFWPFGVAGPPRKAWGGFGHPHTAGMGWPATPWPKMGWSGHPIFWARGGSSHPNFSLFFFLFFFKKKKLISFFFQKKKKNPKICKTMPFWTSPKRRSFGVEGIMDNLPPKGS
jgi:hypothetical protein